MFIDDLVSIFQDHLRTKWNAFIALLK